jgi:hypothetical protein
MELRVKFAGGPMDGMTALTDGLDEMKVFFNDEDRRVICYFRADELLYAYDHGRSVKLTAIYDDAKAEITQKEPSSIRWDEQAETEENHE